MEAPRHGSTFSASTQLQLRNLYRLNFRVGLKSNLVTASADLMYVNDDKAMFRKEAVTIKNGRAVLTASRTTSQGPYSAPWGDQLAEAEYTSGMLQGWNKFCFTGEPGGGFGGPPTRAPMGDGSRRGGVRGKGVGEGVAPGT